MSYRQLSVQVVMYNV